MKRAAGLAALCGAILLAGTFFVYRRILPAAEPSFKRSGHELPGFTPAALPTTETAPPPPRALSYIAVHTESGTAVAGRNADIRRPPASLTKLLAAVTLLEKADLAQVVSVPDSVSALPENKAGLRPGETIALRELLPPLLVGSANDAAATLAAGFPGGESAFVGAMNATAARIGMKNSAFKNAHGLDADGQHSTAREMALLARYALNKPTIRELVQRKTYEARTEKGRLLSGATTNQLLDNTLVFGIKTGQTPAAGGALIALSKKEDRELVTVVLQSSNRFGDSSTLIHWFFDAVQW